MKAYLILGLLALLFTHAISAVVEAETTVALIVDGLASIAEKSTEAVASFPRAPSAAIESITKRSASNALTSSVRALATPSKGKCVHNAPGCSKCGDCCVFRLRSKQWIEPDTNVVVLPMTSGCVPVPIEGQYSLVTNECTNWFKNCTMWSQRDCTGAPNARSLAIPKDIDTWYGTTFYIRAISCSPA